MIMIAILLLVTFVAWGISKGTKDDPCWKCDKDDCTGCPHWKEMTGDES